jgi:hypothetical protein
VVGDLNIAPDDVDCSSEWGKFFLDGEDGTGEWQSRAQELAKKEGEAKLADWKKQADEGKLGATSLVSRDQAAKGLSLTMYWSRRTSKW